MPTYQAAVNEAVTIDASYDWTIVAPPTPFNGAAFSIVEIGNDETPITINGNGQAIEAPGYGEAAPQPTLVVSTPANTIRFVFNEGRSAWIPTPGTPPSHVRILSDLDDVAENNPVDEDVLTWNAASSQWEPGAGGSGVPSPPEFSVQVNFAGEFGGVPEFTFDVENILLNVGRTTARSQATVDIYNANADPYILICESAKGGLLTLQDDGRFELTAGFVWEPLDERLTLGSITQGNAPELAFRPSSAETAVVGVYHSGGQLRQGLRFENGPTADRGDVSLFAHSGSITIEPANIPAAHFVNRGAQSHVWFPNDPVNGYVWTCIDGITGEGAWREATGGGGTPAGPDRAVQFNDGGAFAGTSNLIFSSSGILEQIADVSYLWRTSNNASGAGWYSRKSRGPSGSILSGDAVGGFYAQGMVSTAWANAGCMQFEASGTIGPAVPTDIVFYQTAVGGGSWRETVRFTNDATIVLKGPNTTHDLMRFQRDTGTEWARISYAATSPNNVDIESTNRPLTLNGYNTQFVGIGTDDPFHKLHIYHPGTTYILIDAPTANDHGFQWRGAGATQWSLLVPGGGVHLQLDGSDTPNVMQWRTDGEVRVGSEIRLNGTTGYSQWRENNEDRVTIDPRDSLVRVYNTAGTWRAELRSWGASNDWGALQLRDVANSINVYASAENGGELGIGTTTPSALIEARGPTTNLLTLTREGAGDAQFRLNRDGAQRWLWGVDDSNADALYFRGTAGASAEWLTISQTGNVGVGTGADVEPGAKLHVKGQVLIAGATPIYYAECEVHCPGNDRAFTAVRADANDAGNAFEAWNHVGGLLWGIGWDGVEITQNQRFAGMEMDTRTLLKKIARVLVGDEEPDDRADLLAAIGEL